MSADPPTATPSPLAHAEWIESDASLVQASGSGLLWKNIYKKDFPAGTITLAGNSASYTIIVVNQ